MTRDEVFERADEITAETRYRLQFAREAREAGFEAGRRSAFAEMARAWELAAKAVTQPVDERRWGPGGRAHFADPRPGDFPGRNAETELEAGT
jgi:hypothetical protein